jgi:tripartite-type tricarboxylate transporter receptor subunit TctC
MKKSALSLALLLGISVSSIHAANPTDSWPNKPITVIIGSSAGGSADVLTRIVLNELGKELNTTFVVENRPGAGGTIGMQAIKRQEPDGYTLGYANVNTLSVGPSLFKNLPYDVNKDFEPVGMMFNLFNVLSVRADHPSKTTNELLTLAKDNPGKMSWGASGIGSSGHIAGELLRNMANLDVQFVPYQGDPQTLQDLIGGRIEYIIGNSSVVIPLVESGKLRALGITSQQRVPIYPDLPTIQEAGINGYESVSWGGIVVPTGTPAPIVKKLNTAMNKVLQSDAVKTPMSKLGAVPTPGSQNDFRKLIASEQIKYRDLIEAANIPKQ